MNYLRINQRRVKEIELSRWVEYFLNDALHPSFINVRIQNRPLIRQVRLIYTDFFKNKREKISVNLSHLPNLWSMESKCVVIFHYPANPIPPPLTIEFYPPSVSALQKGYF